MRKLPIAVALLLFEATQHMHASHANDGLELQIDCVVPTRTVFVQHHAGLTSPAMLVAALNGAHLDASLAPPRSAKSKQGQWLPPWPGALHGHLICCLPFS